MALLCPKGTGVGGATTRAIQHYASDESVGTTSLDSQWPGSRAFSELGVLFRTFELKGQATTITVGLFHDDEAYYFASYRPYAVGAAETWQDAVKAWLRELDGLRESAKQLGQNVGAATAKDVQCLRDFFGSL